MYTETLLSSILINIKPLKLQFVGNNALHLEMINIFVSCNDIFSLTLFHQLKQKIFFLKPEIA